MLALNPHSTNPASALGWIQGILLGNAATAVAIIAIAAVGYLMLTGRIDARRAAQAVLGCFIIFGASTIAGGILGAIKDGGGEVDLVPSPPPAPQPAAPAASRPSASPYDPYAGAALPSR